MFEWLEREIAMVHTPKFHLVDGPVEVKLKEAVMRSSLPLPSSYREFIIRFGNVKLYRDQRGSYRIGVFAGPREATTNDGTRIYQIGFYDDAKVFVKPLSGSEGSPIFECEADDEEQVADTFEEWLMASCADVRNAYGHEK